MFDQKMTQKELSQSQTIRKATNNVVHQIELGNFNMLPQYFLRFQASTLTHAELLTMLYIFDHTLGYKDHTTGGRKFSDAISQSQFLHGVRRQDGVVVDTGAGVSERSLNRALKGLEAKGFIRRHNRTSKDGRHHLTTVYTLDLKQAGSQWLYSATNEYTAPRTPAAGQLTAKTHTTQTTLPAAPKPLTKKQAVADAVPCPVETGKQPPVSYVKQRKGKLKINHFNGANTPDPEKSGPGEKGCKPISTGASKPASAQLSLRAKEPVPVAAKEDLLALLTTTIPVPHTASTTTATPLANWHRYSPQFYGEYPRKLQDTKENSFKKNKKTNNNITPVCMVESEKPREFYNNSSAHNGDRDTTKTEIVKVVFTTSSQKEKDGSAFVTAISQSSTKLQRCKTQNRAKAKCAITVVTPALLARSKGATAATTKSPIRPLLSTSTLQSEDKNRQAFVQELVAAGINRSETMLLAEILCKNARQPGPNGYVSACLKYIECQKGVKNRSGLLVYLIKTNWQPLARSYNHYQKTGSVDGNHREKVLRSWAKYSGETITSYKSSTTSATFQEPVDETRNVTEYEPATPYQAAAIPGQAQCSQVWLQVCQTVIREWGVAPQVLAGSYLAVEQNCPNTLLLHLGAATNLTAQRYRLSQLIKAQLGLGTEWRVVDKDPTAYKDSVAV